jgi:4-oxalocrotonate tautomerase
MHPIIRRSIMPHVIVKLYPGRSEEQKIKLADEIVKNVVTIAKCDEESVSVAFEEIEKEEWPQKVYKPDILDKKDSLYKEPGYNPFK